MDDWWRRRASCVHSVTRNHMTCIRCPKVIRSPAVGSSFLAVCFITNSWQQPVLSKFYSETQRSEASIPCYCWFSGEHTENRWRARWELGDTVFAVPISLSHALNHQQRPVENQKCHEQSQRICIPKAKGTKWQRPRRWSKILIGENPGHFALFNYSPLCL